MGSGIAEKAEKWGRPQGCSLAGRAARPVRAARRNLNWVSWDREVGSDPKLGKLGQGGFLNREGGSFVSGNEGKGRDKRMP